MENSVWQQLLFNEDDADIHFVIGVEPNQEKIAAQSCIIKKISPYFKDLVKSCDANGNIPFDGCDNETLRNLLRFTYTRDISLNSKNTLKTLKAAQKFGMKEIEKIAIKYCNYYITDDNCLDFLQTAIEFNHEFIKEKSFILIDNAIAKICLSNAFCELSADNLELIIKQNSLDINEVDLFKALLKWADAECKRKNIDNMDTQNKRNVLGKLLYLIRYPIITCDQFKKEIARNQIFTVDERFDLSLYLGMKFRDDETSKSHLLKNNSPRCIPPFSVLLYTWYIILTFFMIQGENVSPLISSIKPLFDVIDWTRTIITITIRNPLWLTMVVCVIALFIMKFTSQYYYMRA